MPEEPLIAPLKVTPLLKMKLSFRLPPVRFAILLKVKPLGKPLMLPAFVPVIVQVVFWLGPTRVAPPAMLTGALKLEGLRVIVPVPSARPMVMEVEPVLIAARSVVVKSKVFVLLSVAPEIAIFCVGVPG